MDTCPLTSSTSRKHGTAAIFCFDIWGGICIALYPQTPCFANEEANLVSLSSLNICFNRNFFYSCLFLTSFTWACSSFFMTDFLSLSSSLLTVLQSRLHFFLFFSILVLASLTVLLVLSGYMPTISCHLKLDRHRFRGSFWLVFLASGFYETWPLSWFRGSTFTQQIFLFASRE